MLWLYQYLHSVERLKPCSSFKGMISSEMQGKSCCIFFTSFCVLCILFTVFMHDITFDIVLKFNVDAETVLSNSIVLLLYFMRICLVWLWVSLKSPCGFLLQRQFLTLCTTMAP